MEEAEYIAELKRRWPRDHTSVEPSPETMDLTLKALRDYPQSEKLWIMRGDLLQLVDFDDGTDLNESEKCYRKAIGINPRSSEAYLELAHFLDSVMNKPRKAKQYFEKARRAKNA
ncbi:tetratricopeptide repeat protein [Arenicella xantha]|uniref:Tetratricopeptide repeat protein n=1 Tax=Arenicella xantha TaxID=644221 RepID=A0A395JEK1_9GAMM|nr:tetratricopeptide repeat protein [Arenicella xantha]RBP44836.1 tetratricopeptide repeat protein [Arenicella xantha]